MMEQNLALKDRENMRLREAFYLNMLRAFPEKSHEEIRNEIDKLYGAANYDDLMAWHDQQLGEPVAYVDKQSLVNFENGLSTKEWMWAKSDSFLIPLYALRKDNDGT